MITAQSTAVSNRIPLRRHNYRLDIVSGSLLLVAETIIIYPDISTQLMSADEVPSRAQSFDTHPTTFIKSKSLPQSANNAPCGLAIIGRYHKYVHPSIA